MSSTITVSVPGAVWYDALDPDATTMERELELPRWRIVKRGRGKSFVYDDTPLDVAHELARYLADRGSMLLSNSDPEFDKLERGWYRAMIRTAERIDEQLREARS